MHGTVSPLSISLRFPFPTLRECTQALEQPAERPHRATRRLWQLSRQTPDFAVLHVRRCGVIGSAAIDCGLVFGVSAAEPLACFTPSFILHDINVGMAFASLPKDNFYSRFATLQALSTYPLMFTGVSRSWSKRTHACLQLRRQADSNSNRRKHNQRNFSRKSSSSERNLQPRKHGNASSTRNSGEKQRPQQLLQPP